MPATKTLTTAERKEALKALPGWVAADKGKAIARSFKFADFGEAFAFMARSALAAEKMDHHPDWSNSWNAVAVKLSTHSAGGVTALDVKLAGVMNAIAGR